MTVSLPRTYFFLVFVYVMIIFYVLLFVGGLGILSSVQTWGRRGLRVARRCAYVSVGGWFGGKRTRGDAKGIAVLVTVSVVVEVSYAGV